MERLHRFLGGKPQQSQPVLFDDDIVYPIHFLDVGPWKDVIMIWTMKFNDVLDPHKLHSALAKVLETGDWKKFGGRVRQKGGKYEIRVPRTFTKDRPALTFTKEEIKTSIDEHPLARRLPKPSANPSVQASSQDFVSLGLRPDAPKLMETYLVEDLPSISVHVVVFADATLVSFMWPHLLMDAVGRSELMKAWTLALNDKSAEIPPLLGAWDDVAWEAADPKHGHKDYILESKRIKGWRLFAFAMRMRWDRWWASPVRSHIIFIPKETVEKLRDQAKAELEAVERGGEIISRGDTLISWMFKILASSQPRRRPMTLLSTVELRSRLPKVFEAKGAYVQNLLAWTSLLLSPEETVALSMGELATRNRQAIATQSEDDNLLGYLQTFRRGIEAGELTIMRAAEVNAVVFDTTNAVKANFHNTVNFGPAVVRPGDVSAARRNPPGTMIYHHPATPDRVDIPSNLASMNCDRDGNFWIIAAFTADVWDRFEEEVKALSGGETEKHASDEVGKEAS